MIFPYFHRTMKKLQNFFWLCSGADRRLLLQTPTEHNKYTSIGATVFFTGLFAAISGAYALFFIFNDLGFWLRIVAALFFGILWGLMIFNLDRFIVSSLKKQGNFWQELKLASPRILLAGIIAIVISKPLELQIFHTSIEIEMEKMKQADYKKQEDTLAYRFAAQIAVYDSTLSNLKSEIEAKTKQRNYLDEEARKEADGSGGTQKRGAATIYKLKKADAEKAEIELVETKNRNLPLIAKNDSLKSLLIAQRDSLKNNIKRGDYNGFDKQLDAFGKAKSQSESIATADWFIMLLFLAIELAPVLVKLMSQRGPYDDLLEIDELSFHHQKVRKIAGLESETKKIVDAL